MKKGRLKNITFSADEYVIALARKKANERDLTLNDAFREWLEQFTRPVSSQAEYDKLMTSMRGVLSGARFSRTKANER